MNEASRARDLLRAGDPAGALKELQTEVRNRPGDAKLRTFLFQLLCVLGQWDRALNQLETAGQLDPSALAMVAMYRDALHCEALRARVFTGRTSPLLFGEPDAWLALLIESMLAAGQGREADAAQLRAEAFGAAPASSGTVDGQRFEWIADADSRLGPVLEAIVNGRYYWIPFSRLARVASEAPTDLRDMVWLPAHLRFTNGGEMVAMIPSRYVGSESSDDGLVQLARKTVWIERGADTWHGLGQRTLATDAGDLPLLDVREILIDAVT